MISVDFTSLVFLFSFIAFIFLLDLLFFKPVLSNLKEREGKSAGAKSDLDELQSRIANRFKLLESDQTISEAKLKANSILVEARVKAGQMKESLVQKSAQELSIKVEEMLNAVEHDKEEVISSASTYVDQLSSALTEKLNAMIAGRTSNSSFKDHSLV